MPRIGIKAPKGARKGAKGAGAAFAFAVGFAQRYGAALNRAQDAMGCEVLARCAPLVPRSTGRLLASGKAREGEVVYTAPYARGQYYGGGARRGREGQRGPRWFERMKAGCAAEILRAAKKEAGL